ncbi:MAG: hypothetical protein JSS82_15600 [Bacteroidetes bacterium]|nr:hypothetical protein [Bacteroidota bacterium]
MRRRPYKQKPGPKKGAYSTDPSKWCGFIKEDGSPCRTLKQNGLERCANHKAYNTQIRPTDGNDEAFLPGQSYELPPEMPLNTIDDMLLMLADTLNRVRVGLLPTKIATGVSSLSRELVKLLIAKEKLSPEKQALRTFSRERAAQMAREMTSEQAQEIVRARNASLLFQEVPAEEKKQVMDISQPKLPESKALLAETRKAVERIGTATKKLIEEMPKVLQENDEEDEEEE